MASFENIIKLAKTEGGKFFVMDETGDIKLVILPAGDYERLAKGGKPAAKSEPAIDAEKVNREILHAQLHDLEQEVAHPVSDFRSSQPPRVDLREEVIDPTFDFEGPKVNMEDI
ncbi:MAG TPA: hypothetical protein VHA30_01000 [Patescibacteria group bacterium]|nr:hypothetical protein [Patescibacteria group bacterium]